MQTIPFGQVFAPIFERPCVDRSAKIAEKQWRILVRNTSGTGVPIIATKMYAYTS